MFLFELLFSLLLQFGIKQWHMELVRRGDEKKDIV